MSHSPNTLGIATPKRKTSKDDFYYLDFGQVTYWIDDLPRGSAGQTAKKIFSALKDKNRIELDYEDRLEYLELIREPFHYTASIMENIFVGANFPLNNKQEKIATTTREFYSLMSYGYIIAIEEYFEQMDSPLDKDLLCLLVHRAITYLSRLLLISYQLYIPITSGLWEKLHKLYLFAEKHNINTIQIQNDHQQYIKKTTVNDEYIRALLISLVSPYHLRNHEVGKIYINLERWVNKITLKKPTSRKNSAGQFNVNLHGSCPPHNRNNSAKEKQAEGYRILDTQSLIKEINSELKRSEIISSNTLISVNLEEANMSHDLLQRIKRYWSSKSEKANDRKKTQKKTNIIIGISAIYRFLKNASMQGLNETDKKILDDYLKTRNSNTKKGGAKPKFEVIIKEPELIPNQWFLINETENMVCLQYNTDSPQRLQVGEVIGLQPLEAGQSNQLSVGIISWLKIAGGNEIKLGAKLISPSATAVDINMLARNIDDNGRQKALLFPAIENLNIPSSILTFPTPYRSGSRVSITINGNNIPTCLTKLFNNSGLYCQHEYRKMVVKKKRAARSKKSGDDEVWSSF